MKKLESLIARLVMTISLVMVIISPIASKADTTLDDWTPIFKGIDRTTGRMTPTGGDTKTMVVQILRVDLTDPDVQLLTTPPATNYQARVRETLGQSVSSFLQANQIQVAINANFYDPVIPSSPGLSAVVKGLHISRGFTVSSQDSSQDSSAALFTTNKQVLFVRNNYPPTNTAGIYTAISGRYELISNGVNLANNNTSPIRGDQPRTAVGASEDGKYLFMLVIDGRQPGWSDGAEDEDVSAWFLSVGAYNAVMMDGGGSTTMAMSDCLGNAVRLNRPSDLLAQGHERYVGSHFGVFAKPLIGFVGNVRASKAATSAKLSWTTLSNATSFVEYGATASYGNQTDVESTPALNHSATLSGLTFGSTVYFRIHATDGNGQEYLLESCFSIDYTPIFPLTQVWKYETNNLDAVQWTARRYDDSKWLGQGPGLLYVEDNVDVAPRNTQLPVYSGAGTSNPRIPITYYFRTHFNFTNSTAGVSFLFSNYIDDGAVFYLNGTEIQRVRMPDAPATIINTNLATSYLCGDAVFSCPTVFAVGSESLSGLLKGDNVLAVEVHNYNAGSPDVVFGTDLRYSPGTDTVSEAPRITTDPSSKTVNQGQSAAFAVAATGKDPLSYSWYFNGTVIAGVTTSTFALPGATPGDAGSYRAVVANSVGSATSGVATLTVVVPPVITQHPASVSVEAGKPASFSVSVSGTAPFGYAWSLNGTLIPGANQSSYSIASVSAANVGDYLVTASNGAGSATSQPATLTLLSVPAPTLKFGSAADGKFSLTWTGSGFTLQQTLELETNPIPWTDVPGPVTSGIYTNTVSGTKRFFRLRN